MNGTPYRELFMSVAAMQVYFGLETHNMYCRFCCKEELDILITVPLLRASDVTQWCDFTFFSHIVSKCIISEKSPKML